MHIKVYVYTLPLRTKALSRPGLSPSAIFLAFSLRFFKDSHALRQEGATTARLPDAFHHTGCLQFILLFHPGS